jgi:ligand-binding sensor domain-containing protein
VRWSGSIGEGVTRFDRRTGKTTAFKHDPSDPRSLLDDRVYSVYGDHSGTIWIGTREGLERYDPKTETFVHYRHDKNNPSSLSDNWVWPILEDRAGVLWVGTYRGGLNRFDRVTETFTHFRHDETDARSVGDDRTYSLFQDQSGMIWVRRTTASISSTRHGAFVRYSNNPKNPASLVDSSVYSIHVDRSGVYGSALFAASIGWIVPPERSHFGMILQTRKPGENMVQSILEDRSGVMWMGTQSNGLDR